MRPRKRAIGEVLSAASSDWVFVLEAVYCRSEILS